MHIPNLEIADAFRTAVKETSWAGVSEALAESDKLLKYAMVGSCCWSELTMTAKAVRKSTNV